MAASKTKEVRGVSGNGHSFGSNDILESAIPMPTKETKTKSPKVTESEMLIPMLTIGRVNITLIGIGPLVTHRFSEKSKKQMLDKQMKVAKQGDREAKDPEMDFFEALYFMPGTRHKAILHNEDKDNVWAEGEFGFPAVGIKAAGVRAGTDVGLQMTDLRRQIQIRQEYVKIECDPGPLMREDIVRLSGKVPDLRYRPEFNNWHCVVPIHYNMKMTNVPQIVNLLRTAGFGVGLGEWRSEKGGVWGQFEVDKTSIQELEPLVF